MEIAIFLAIIASLFVSKKGVTSDIQATQSGIVTNNKWNLPDIDSSIQRGVYLRDFDESFEKASHATGVPFALIKAHALRESSLAPGAYHYDNARSGASYGLMQVEWNFNNRFAKYGFDDAVLGRDGSGLYDPDTSAMIGACVIRDNLNWLSGNLRDSINAYNTGGPESKRRAPGNYVDDVINYYQTLIGGSVNG